MVDVPNHGVQILLSDMQPMPTFTAVGQVVEVTPPTVTRGTTPVPAHDDTGGIPKFADALYDGGQVQFRVKHDPALATHDAATGIREAINDGATRDWRIILPDVGATQFDFAGFAVAWSPAPMPVNAGVKMLDFTIDVSGDITEA